MAQCCRTFVVGATGFIGRYMAEASVAAGDTTYILLRSRFTKCPSKAKIIRSLQDKGATVVIGSINDGDFLVKTLRDLKIDMVISAVGGASILDQLVLVDAIKAVGTVKRFLPSEFGHDVDRANPVEPGLGMYNEKRKVRRAAEAAGIPYTYVCCNSIAAWPYYDNTHPADVLPPLDRFQIYGDGNIKAYFVDGTDIGKFTIKAIKDTRALNKCLHFRPDSNYLSMNELASLWEEKIGRILPRVTVTEEDLLAAAEENIIPESIVAAFTHEIFIKGCQTSFSIEEPRDAEVSALYPDSPFRTVSECFDDFLV
ncbi:leucoanthocyanidin reductase-like [Aristolochia californica]|uniref:leucoanthocyanidin reductase-like n=1 Tax=Aristolochia californica TaxID=171875 RepID=UPI0035DF07DB